MSFTSLYRGSFYLMLVASTLVLSIDATDNRFAMLYPLAVGVAAAVAFMTVDRRPGTGISPSFGGLLALGVTGLTLLEWLLDRNLLLLALGHWLVYLELIYMFRAKTIETDWWMFSLGLVQVMVGSVISQADVVGVMLFGWALLALWVLGLFSLQRDALRARAEASGVAPRGSDVSDPNEEPYPGLLNIPFILSGARVTLTTLALGGVIFLAMPRKPGMARSVRGQGHAQHLTGFDDEVQLGQLGEILENDSVVMSIELFDEHDHRIIPSADKEYLWRGATMWSYENGRWKRSLRPNSTTSWSESSTMGRFRPELTPEPVIRQQIKLEPNDSNVLFGLRPLFDASASRLGPEFNPQDGTIFRSNIQPGPYDYEVRSYANPKIPQTGEKALSLAPLIKDEILLRVPEPVLPRLRSIAEEAIADYARTTGLNASEAGKVENRARALEWYLRDSGRFAYTLKLDVIDPNLDPVEDFLVNRKEGHCEYFASALALLLRSVGIPSRVVNGFKGGDWNELVQILSVRQKHAHSWVEAYMGDEPVPSNARFFDRRSIWLTLDPTPGQERTRSLDRVSGFTGHFRQFTDLVRYVWVFYIVGYDADRQNRLLYAPLRALAQEARDGFEQMAEWAQTAWMTLRAWLHFPTTREFFSLRGFLVSFVGLGLVYVAGWLLLLLFRRYWARWFGAAEDALSLQPGAAQYRRLALLLGSCGLERMPAETQEEFARRATGSLPGPAINHEPIADVPRLVVDAFYEVRFGLRVLPEATVAYLESRLDALEKVIKASRE